MSGLRQRLRDAEEILAVAAPRVAGTGPEVRAKLAALLERLKQAIEGQPQSSQVRLGTVALHNLIVSLRSGAAVPEPVLVDEVATAHEAMRALLRDPMFGLSEEELWNATRGALSARGITGPPCGHADYFLDLATHLFRPFPDDPLCGTTEIPVAALSCKHCGCMSTHRLDLLGVLI